MVQAYSARRRSTRDRPISFCEERTRRRRVIGGASPPPDERTPDDIRCAMSLPGQAGHDPAAGWHRGPAGPPEEQRLLASRPVAALLLLRSPAGRPWADSHALEHCTVV